MNFLPDYKKHSMGLDDESSAMKKETGAMAKKALERAFKVHGNPIVTDKETTHVKIPPKDTDLYWVMICSKCKAKMHVAYYNINGIRYMCAGCGKKEGSV
jgi:hypothetical protein